MRHVLKIEPTGTIRAVYSDTLPLARLGSLTVTRASTVKFNAAAQQWEVCWAEQPDLVVYRHPFQG